MTTTHAISRSFIAPYRPPAQPPATSGDSVSLRPHPDPKTGQTGHAGKAARPKALLDQVSSTDKTLLDVDGGHVGIVSGSKAPSQSWREIAAWLAERSG